MFSVRTITRCKLSVELITYFTVIQTDTFPHINIAYHTAHAQRSPLGIFQILAVVTLQGFVLGKLDLLTVSLGKLKFASVTDFSLSKLPRESFIVWGSKTAGEQKNVLWISLDNYPKAEKGKNQIPE